MRFGADQGVTSAALERDMALQTLNQADADARQTEVSIAATAERARKQRDLIRDKLLALWESQLTRDERQEMSRLHNKSAQSPSEEKRG